MQLFSLLTRVIALLTLLFLVSNIPAWRRPGIPKSAPRDSGAAIGFELGGKAELDALGPVWYMDYGFRGSTFGPHQRFYMVKAGWDVNDVPRAAHTQRGEWWQFGNEPNDPAQDDVAPIEYAARYHNFYFTVKAADSAAHVVPAGIANADWQWADAFREAYRAQFGLYPRVDGWNIHNYLLDSCERALDVEEFKARLRAFRAWMIRVGEDGKPLFLTEYGVLYGKGLGACRLPDADVIEFMRATTRWLQQTHMVTAWAWFAINTRNEFNGDLFIDGPTMTPFGEAYRDLVRQGSGSP